MFRLDGSRLRGQGVGFRVVQGSGFRVVEKSGCTRAERTSGVRARKYASDFAEYACHPSQFKKNCFSTNAQWFRGGLEFKAHRLVYHSPYGSRTFENL